MTHSPVVVSPLAHANSQAESDSVGSVPFNRRALWVGTAIVSAIRNGAGLTSAHAFVAPPVDGRPIQAEPVSKSPPDKAGWIRRLMHNGPFADRDPRPERPPRLMPSDAGRHVNAMPAHAMAAGGRPLMMKIPGK